MCRVMLGCLTVALLVMCTNAMPHRRSVSTENHDFRVVCYFTNWAQYRQGSARFVAGNMDPNLCTHLIFSFAKLSDSLNNRLEPYEWNDESTEWSVGNYEALNQLKTANPALKTLLAVGGWTHGVEKFTYMVETPERRQAFIQDAIQFVRVRNFDGLDLDWEFPGYIERGSPAIDKQRFTLLVQELRAAFEAEALRENRERLLLTSACSAGQAVILTGYEIPQVASALDFINVMAYDFHGSWETVTGHHTALYPGSSDVGSNRQLTVSNAVEVWLNGGAPASKLTLGMGLYGRSFTLSGQDTGAGVGQRTSGPGTAGVSTKAAGFLSYYEICSQLESGQLSEEWDGERQVPYASQGNQWIGYDNPESLKIKVDFLKEMGLGGAMVWAVDLDDFNGNCGEEWPLMKAINRALGSGSGTRAPATEAPANGAPATEAPANGAPATEAPANGAPATEAPANGAPATDAQSHEGHDHETDHGTVAPANGAPATEAPANGAPATEAPANGASVTEAPANGAPAEDDVPTTNSAATDASTTDTFSCQGKAGGYYADPASCRMYYICDNGITHRLPCAEGTHFDPASSTCNFPHLAQCDTPNSPLFCDDRADGLHTNPDDCASYYQCSGGLTYTTVCSSGLLWNPNNLSCDWPRNVNCDRSAAIFSCTDRGHGYYPDPADCTGFYHCAGGRTYRKSCGNLYWNQDITGCDYPSNVQCNTST